MPYVDGFVIAVPTANKAAYRKVAEMMVPVFKDFGATQIVECWGDDVPDGEVTSFPMAVKAKKDETVVFSWIVWPDKATRDAAYPAFMEDERLKDLGPDKMPFDGKRMILGGFEMMVEG
ncbi:DUF1428 domain-containing protein [Hyphobacterium sp.]|jgi:uncharacterized protein YbaA (DUF1428 family)|uniref:DUF1428 domain-containing protein n=1 Tax=Hyphobacterium sp. TaxID=2004662 RepID=UPI003BA98D95